MPTAICPSYAFGRRMRVTKLDGCGRPLSGPRNVVVTKAFTEVAISPNILTGDEITVKNAGGELCISDKALDQIKWLTIKITMCSQDPDLISILNPTYYEEVDEGANPIGFRMDLTTTYAYGFALELWLDATGIDLCASATAQGAYGYLLLPFCQGGAPGDLTVSNKEVLTIWNGRTLANPKWGVGPYNVRQDPQGNPKPLLTPVASSQPLVFFATSLAPPAAACGGQAVPATQLPAPSGLAQLGAGTQTTITAFWTSVASAQGYTVTAKPPTGPSIVQKFPSTVTQGTITGLTSGTTYGVTIVANGDGINTLDSSPSPSVNMSTAASNPLTAPVITAGASPGPTLSTFNVTFPPVANAQSYVATATSAGNPTLSGLVSGSTQLTASFTGAVANTTYAVTVVAKGDGITYSDSPPSNSVNMKTLQQLATPTNVTMGSKTAAADFSVTCNTVTSPSATSYSAVGSKTGTTSPAVTVTGTVASNTVTFEWPSGISGVTTGGKADVVITAKGDGTATADSNPTPIFTTVTLT